MSIEKKPFGKLPSGEAVDLYVITNASGASASISNYGGILASLRVPDANGALVDVVLGAGDVSGYIGKGGYLGALIGRVGNRIGKGLARFGGGVLKLAQNSNGQHLHGGNVGFDSKIWAASADDKQNRLTLTYTSPDGEENYPGTLDVTVEYTFSDDNALSIHYRAVADKDTLCNLTNHSYFNLSGEASGAVLDHEIRIDADRLTVVDADCIPTGELRDVTGTVFDFRQPRRIADGLREGEASGDQQIQFGGGYDHNYALSGDGYREIVSLRSSDTGIRMAVHTDLPGVQFYIGNFLDGSFIGKSGKPYNKRDGLCLETQFFPDSINHNNFAPCLLKAGDVFDSTTTYKFSVE